MSKIKKKHMSPNGCHSAECVNAAKFCDIDFGDDGGDGQKIGAQFLRKITCTHAQSNIAAKDRQREREIKRVRAWKYSIQRCIQWMWRAAHDWPPAENKIITTKTNSHTH